MRKQTVPLLLVVLAVGLAACSGRSDLEEVSPDERTVLVVDNRSSLDMNIYVIREGGDRERLGTATAHLRSEFTIPSRMVFGVSSLRFQADPIGARRAPVTESIPVSAGDTVEMQIPPNF